MNRNDRLAVIYAVVGAICLVTGIQLFSNQTVQDSALSLVDYWLIRSLSGFSLIGGVSLIVLSVLKKLKNRT